MRGWVVTGTDTGVGKTVTSAALCRLRGGSTNVAYVKPIQSGSDDGDDDAADVRALAGVPTVTGAVLGPSLAPAVAARIDGKTFTHHDLVDVVTQAARTHPDAELVIEGAGGLLVELGTDGTTIADLARELDLPLLVVARPGLGTLNHSVLTLEAIDRRGLSCAGLVVCGQPHEPDQATRTNLAELDRLTAGRLVGAIPARTPLTSAALDDAPNWLAPSLGGAWSRPSGPGSPPPPAQPS